jgi:hypothetical protein
MLEAQDACGKSLAKLKSEYCAKPTDEDKNVRFSDVGLCYHGGVTNRDRRRA